MSEHLAVETKTILLAESDFVVRKALRRTLESFGYHILEAATGEEAVTFANRHRGPIDLLLSDISVKGLHGPGLARIVTDIRPFTRVLFLTGEPEASNTEAGLCPGCWLLVRKPFRPRELAQALDDFLSRQLCPPHNIDSLIRAGLFDAS